MTERLVGNGNGTVTTLSPGEGLTSVATVHVDLEARKRLLDNAAAERQIAREAATKPKYQKVATIPWDVWVQWSIEVGMPLGKMPAAERDIFIRKKLATGDYSKLHARDKV